MSREILIIKWRDAFSNMQWIEESLIKEWAESTEPLITSTGFVLIENENYIVLAGSYKEDGFSECAYSNIHKIPKAWVISRLNLSDSKNEPQ